MKGAAACKGTEVLILMTPWCDLLALGPVVGLVRDVHVAKEPEGWAVLQPRLVQLLVDANCVPVHPKVSSGRGRRDVHIDVTVLGR